MGLFQRLVSAVRGDKVTASKVINLLNQGASLASFGRDLYNIPEIRTAINSIAEKVGCIPFYHARATQDGDIEAVPGSVQYVLTVRTNKYQTPQVFWTYVTTRVLLYNNVYVFMDWDDRGNLAGLYVLPFSQHEFFETPDGKLGIKFPSVGSYTFYYDDIIHLQRFPTQLGGARKQATGGYIQIVQTLQEQAVKDSVSSGRVSALLKTRTPLKGSDMKKKLEEFKELFLTAENSTGFGMIGAEFELEKLDMKISPLNKDVMEAIIGYLYNYFGTSKEIVTLNATELQNDQFIGNSIKPLAYQIEEELTYKLFSFNEIAHNNRILAELIDLEISTLAAKTAFYKEMLFGGVLNRNEIRKRVGFKKGGAELDKFMESKNFQALGLGNYTVEGGEKDEPGK